MRRGLYVEADPFSYAADAFEIYRYRRVQQKLRLSDGSTLDYCPVFLVVQPHRLYAGVNSLEGAQIVDLFDLPLTGIPADRRQLLKEIKSLYYPLDLANLSLENSSFILHQDYRNWEQVSTFSNLTTWGDHFPLQDSFASDSHEFTHLSRAQVLLDFLFDIRFYHLWEFSPLLQNLRAHLEKHFPLNGIYYKAQFYYFLREKEQESVDAGLLSEQLKYLTEEAKGIIGERWEYEAYLELRETWFPPPPIEETTGASLQEAISDMLPIEKSFIGSGHYQFMNSILFIASDPSPKAQLWLGTEIRNAERALQQSVNRDRWWLVPKIAAWVEDLRLGLLDHQPQILHFAGHGRKVMYKTKLEIDRGYKRDIVKYVQNTPLLTKLTHVEKREQNYPENSASSPGRGFTLSEKAIEEAIWDGLGALLFSRKSGQSRLVSSFELIQIIASYKKHLTGVILNSCYSLSLAQRLSHSIPLVIGIKGRIPDNHALSFSKEFYRHLGEGMDAFESGMIAYNMFEPSNKRQRKGYQIAIFYKGICQTDSRLTLKRTDEV